MDNYDLAALILSGAPLWVQETVLPTDPEYGLQVGEPYRVQVSYADLWALSRTVENLDLFVEHGDELYHLGDLSVAQARGLTAYLGTRRLEKMAHGKEKPPQPWDGFCPECLRLYSRHCVCLRDGDLYTCMECGHEVYSPLPPTQETSTYPKRCQRLYKIFSGLGREEAQYYGEA